MTGGYRNRGGSAGCCLPASSKASYARKSRSNLAYVDLAMREPRVAAHEQKWAPRGGGEDVSGRSGCFFNVGKVSQRLKTGALVFPQKGNGGGGPVGLSVPGDALRFLATGSSPSAREQHVRNCFPIFLLSFLSGTGGGGLFFFMFM